MIRKTLFMLRTMQASTINCKDSFSTPNSCLRMFQNIGLSYPGRSSRIRAPAKFEGVKMVRFTDPSVSGLVLHIILLCGVELITGQR